MLIRPSPNENAGTILSAHAIPLPTLFESWPIHLKIKVIMGAIPPTTKLKKYTTP